jgi:hypothetical protein
LEIYRVVRGLGEGAEEACSALDGVAAARIEHCLRTRGGLAYEDVRKWVDPTVGQARTDHEVVDYYVQDGSNGVCPLELREKCKVRGCGVVVFGRDFKKGGQAVELVLAFEDRGISGWLCR